MGGPIFLIKSDIHRVRDGARVDPPGVIFRLPGPQDAATAHTHPNSNTHTNPAHEGVRWGCKILGSVWPRQTSFLIILNFSYI